MPTLAELNTELRTLLYKLGIIHNDAEYQLFILSNYDIIYSIHCENNRGVRDARLALLLASLTFADTDSAEDSCPSLAV